MSAPQPTTDNNATSTTAPVAAAASSSTPAQTAATVAVVAATGAVVAKAPAAAPVGAKAVWKMVAPFALGGASGMMATCFIQPVDMVKVQLQLRGEGAKTKSAGGISVARELLAKEGFMYFYKGLSAGLLRQATYTTVRLGCFRTISDYLKGDSKTPPPFWKSSVAGLLAGGIGAVFGTPADVALIRMQADITLPVDQRRNYKNVGNALVRMVKEEGVKGLFAGNTPVVLRAMALNFGMLATHDHAQDYFKQYTSNYHLANLGAKAVAGFFASFCSLPFDMVKTRLQKQKPGADGKLMYNGVLDCTAKILAKEGPMALYRGFPTYYFRIAPHAMLTLYFLDFLNVTVKKAGW